MSKSFEEKISDRKMEEARIAFSSYVQSVAFNMTLSRNMVDALWAVREFGAVYSNGAKDHVRPFISNHSAPLMKALERRGLVWHDYVPNAEEGHRYFKLTRAGELMCDLLVQAGLIAAVNATRKRAP